MPRLKGRVIRVIAGFYDIDCDNNEYRVRAAGKMRHKEESPVVGDFVTFTPNEFLHSIEPRQNSLVRPKVANIDQAVIVTSLKDPDYSSMLLNKTLAIIESNNIKPIILFTKIDLVDDSPYEEYKNQGYDVFVLSNQTQEGVEEIKKIFKDKLTVFTGQTGAGKSSTINSIAGTDRETQEISKSLGRGKHTTRVVEIIDWFGGKLIDTPGFSSIEFNLDALALSKSYHDFRKLSERCKFNRNCLHDKENDCEIKRSVESGVISKQRYNDYIRLLNEVKNV